MLTVAGAAVPAGSAERPTGPATELPTGAPSGCLPEAAADAVPGSIRQGMAERVDGDLEATWTWL